MKPSPSTDSSMEQILASIRRSIADISEEGVNGNGTVPRVELSELDHSQDYEDNPEADAVAPEPVTEGGPDRVVELRPRPTGVRAEAPEAPGEAPDDLDRPQPKFGFTLRREAPAPQPRAAAPRPASPERRPAPATPANTQHDGPMRFSPAQAYEEPPILSTHADAAVTRAFNNLADTILSSEARTLEDLVRDMLRPMLKSWLDSNLPPLVERLVREEIERVARGQRHG